MSHYQNFTLDLPSRIRQLDAHFHPIAHQHELQVTYLLMKASSAFLLPYERLQGSSGAKDQIHISAQRIRVHLHLDKPFLRSRFAQPSNSWSSTSVDDFSVGPDHWIEEPSSTRSLPTWDALETVRHALAHSNLQFDGIDGTIQRIYFGKSLDYHSKSRQYRVLRGSIQDVHFLIDAWLDAMEQAQSTRTSLWEAIRRQSELESVTN